jgi:hypothetical protein
VCYTWNIVWYIVHDIIEVEGTHTQRRNWNQAEKQQTTTKDSPKLEQKPDVAFRMHCLDGPFKGAKR